MLYRQGILKLSLIVGLMGLGGLLSFAAQSPQAGKAKDINILMEERRDVLAKIVDVLKRRNQQGLTQLDAVCRAHNELLSAELELAKTREDRLAALNSQLANFQTLENQALEYQKLGVRGGEVEVVLSATAGRLQAEIQILREWATDK